MVCVNINVRYPLYSIFFACCQDCNTNVVEYAKTTGRVASCMMQATNGVEGMIHFSLLAVSTRHYHVKCSQCRPNNIERGFKSTLERWRITLIEEHTTVP